MKERDIYNYIDSILIPPEKIKLYNMFIKNYKKTIDKYQGNLIIQEMNIGLCCSNENPIKNIRFYDKNSNNIKLNIEDISSFITTTNNELYIRFFTKTKDIIPHIKLDIIDLIHFIK